MTLRALITGTLYGDPEPKTGQSGKGYTRAKLRADVSKDEPSVWVSLIAFGSLADTLAYLKANDSVSVAGKAKLTAWTGKDGNPQAGMDLVIDELVALKGQRPAAGQPKAAATAPKPALVGTVADEFDDEIPF